MVQIIKKISPYNHSSGNDIKYIVIHSTGNTNDTAKNNADYFYRADRQASAHYFVDDSYIYQVVEENQAAWHCGDGGNRYGIGNHNSIGIEMCGTDKGHISDKTINNTIELVKALQSRYKLPNDRIVRHYDVSRKNCPSQFSPNNWARWTDFKNRLGGNSSTAPNTQANNIKNNSEIKKEEMFVNVKTFCNGSTRENIWSSNAHENKIGYLDPYEKCKCLGVHNGHAIVMYTGSNGYDKVGFTESTVWAGCIK